MKSRRQVDSPLGGEFATLTHPRWDYHATHYGTDNYGFSALPAGGKGHLSSGGIGERLHWWSSTPSFTEGAWTFNISYASSVFFEDDGLHMQNGFSVRCIKD